MNLKHFSEEQIRELELVFGISRVPDSDLIKVRDGVIKKGHPVWWRNVDGPEEVDSVKHWENIKKFPDVYSICRPRIEYVD